MSILVNRRYLSHHFSLGTLAEVSSISGTPREILNDVQEADWAPNGTDLAVVRHVAGRSRLEFPAGKLLYQPAGWISNPRVSPDGDKIAFLEHPVQGDNRGWVSVIELNGKKTILTPEWAGEEGLAWSPDGREVWFTANKSGGANSLFAVSNAGKIRTLATAPVNLILFDVARNGNVLVSGGNESSEFFAFDPGANREHDVSWLDWGGIRDLSPDGRTLIFTHFGEKSGKNYSVYLRQLNASTAVRLGPGSGWGLSPDGKQVISILVDPPQITLLPTGAGQEQRLPSNGIEEYGLGGSWFPDGRKIVFIGREHNHAPRTYMQEISGGNPAPLTPEGVTGTLLSSDGKSLIATDTSGNRLMFPTAGGSPHPLQGLSSEDKIIRFSGDDHSLFVLDDENASGKIYRVDLGTGRRELWKTLTPADPAGIREFKTALLTPDGKYYVYGLTRSLTSLYLTHIGQ
jgi:eukaryotic-like serine/threonine-protein kinase